ncbi:SCP2 domain-containing protein [Glaciecola sp. MF2-115]|uniref:ubiquinone biosynthesis accessory factor UbiJ n=1 Tax=Glaciecola sp. MF2-115 TaxID=3384827 RepID=UPI0039A29E00
MHQAQILTAAVEFAINKVLSFDEDSHLLLKPLIGKQCEIKLHELPFPLVFNFHEKGVELSSIVEADSAHAETTGKQAGSKSKQSKNQNQCSISLSVFIINELKDTSNITQLIRDNKLDFDGNLQIAQNMSALFDGLHIDIEELLSKHIGDVAAHTAVQKAESFGQLVKRNHKLAMQALSDVLLDEKPIGVRPIMVENFIQEVSEVRDAAARLEARLAILESKFRKKK